MPVFICTRERHKPTGHIQVPVLQGHSESAEEWPRTETGGVVRARSRLWGKQGGDSDETGEEDAAVAAAEKEEMKGGGCRCLEVFFNFVGCCPLPWTARVVN